MNSNAEYDVVIGGASIAGCAAAVLLARRGARVALLERRTEPDAYKVLCTHYIQACAYPVLEELGLVPELEKAGAVRTGGRWYTRWGWTEPRPRPGEGPLPYAYNVRRSTLDPLMRARAAGTPGVDLFLGHTVVGLLTDVGGRTVGVRASTADGERELRARLVVGADGKDSAIAGLAGLRARTHENARFIYFAHFRQMPLEGGGTHAWFLEPDVAFAMPTDGGVTVVSVLPDKKKLPAFRADLEGSFTAFVRDLPGAPPIQAAERVTKITGTVSYPLHSRRPTAPGLALVGDAATTSDPLWGVGCGWALQSAQWLADAVGPALAEQGELGRALDGYRRRHRRGVRGHHFLAADYAKGRRFNLFERLMFSAAVRDPDIARHLHLFESRLISPWQLMSPTAVLRALRASLRSA
ncbi:NAD(P)/FAD-dependent oxidoreductase [Kitasatospora azatica]|uniref:NAD(P)/FAD-dependent oxidoreductase n=1 Tax=Kitasatospora azatica TaxID=58347 RepID=UPI00055C7F19|nr:NAD(P)/FAD-dependent oxidoreductase [Kitasatospora azatica]